MARYNPFVPDFRIRHDDFTVLMAVDGEHSEALMERGEDAPHAKFQLQGWTQEATEVRWRVCVDETDVFEAEVSVVVRGSGVVAVLSVDGGGEVAAAIPARWDENLSSGIQRWERTAFASPLLLSKGTHTIALRLGGAGLPTCDQNMNRAGQKTCATFEAMVFDVRLVRVGVREALTRRALAGRADTRWLHAARFGVMVHWTSQSQPLAGAQKPYAEAVEAFDVGRFARQVAETGAGFVVFTTAHAESFFPAPNAALDAVYPGHTAKRDLVRELVDALSAHGIGLMLYYHIGADLGYMKASGFYDTDTSILFSHWKAIVREAGERYGRGLRGWWFDDGATNYYYRSPPWEALTEAARAGNPHRIVGYNAWMYPSPTLFQDVHWAETEENPAGTKGLLVAGGNGTYPAASAHGGLQSCPTVILETDWVHDKPDTPIGKPRHTAESLRAYLGQCALYRNVPIFNFEITQEGLLSAESVALFKKALL